MADEELHEVLSDMLGDDVAFQVIDKEREEFSAPVLCEMEESRRRELLDNLVHHFLHIDQPASKPIYGKLLASLGLHSAVNVRSDMPDNQRKEPETERPNFEEKVDVNAAVDQFHENLNNYLGEFEAILNTYWRKGVEAELQGADPRKVNKLIDNALYAAEHDLERDYHKFLDNMGLQDHDPHESHYRPTFDLLNTKLLEDREDSDSTLSAWHVVKSFWEDTRSMVQSLEKVFIDSFISDVELERAGKDPSHLIQETEVRIKQIWDEFMAKFDGLSARLLETGYTPMHCTDETMERKEEIQELIDGEQNI